MEERGKLKMKYIHGYSHIYNREFLLLDLKEGIRFFSEEVEKNGTWLKELVMSLKLLINEQDTNVFTFQEYLLQYVRKDWQEFQ